MTTLTTDPTSRIDAHLDPEDTVFSQTALATPSADGAVLTALVGGSFIADALPTDSLNLAGGEPDILLAEDKTLTADLPCRVQDADLWFAERPAELERAKEFCADCPVRATCLAGALARREPWGVWGGEIFERGVVIARKRPRGRPRKDSRPGKDDVAA